MTCYMTEPFNIYNRKLKFDTYMNQKVDYQKIINSVHCAALFILVLIKMSNFKM